MARIADLLKKKKPADATDDAVNRLHREEAKRHKEKVKRRKWSIETAMMAGDEMPVDERIALARRIESYVWEGIEP